MKRQKFLMVFIICILMSDYLFSQSTNFGGNGFDSSKINSRLVDRNKKKIVKIYSIGCDQP